MKAPNGAYLRRDIQQAADLAYCELGAAKNIDAEQVHRLSVCYEASKSMVRALSEKGYDSAHRILVGQRGEHSLVSVSNGEGEIWADPTWQQFLPPERKELDLPKVLIGSLGSLAAQAQSYGTDPQALSIWDYSALRNPQDMERANRQAEQAADRATTAGNWQKFMHLPTLSRRRFGRIARGQPPKPY